MDKPKSIIMFDAVGGNQRVYDAVETDKIFESLENDNEELKLCIHSKRIDEADYFETKQELKKLREKYAIALGFGELANEQAQQLQKLREYCRHFVADWKSKLPISEPLMHQIDELLNQSK